MSEKTVKTLAKESQDQLQEETQNASLLQGPFATRNYDMTAIRLQTTLPELVILNGTPAIVRPGFNQDDTSKTITIPAIFAKINGIPDDIDEYNLFFDKIEKSSKLEALFNGHLSTAEWELSDDETSSILSDLSVKTLMTSTAWAYSVLNRSLQKKIASAIVDTINSWDFIFDKTFENKKLVLRICLDMPKELLEMSNEVDYPQEVPLLVVKHDDTSSKALSEITTDDIIGYNLMHHLGWDIEIYSPSGLSSIENILNEDQYDIFYNSKMKATNASTGTKVSMFDKIQLFFKELYIKIKKIFKKKR